MIPECRCIRVKIFEPKSKKSMKKLFAVLTATILSLQFALAADAPKKLLVVTVTTGFRHSSIPTAEKILEQLGKSSGEFTVDFVHQPPDKPANLKPNATDEQKAAY